MIANGSTTSIEYTLRLADRRTVDSNVGKRPLAGTQGVHEVRGLSAILDFNHFLAGREPRFDVKVPAVG